MTIDEKLVRRSQDDVIEIGSALEILYNSPTGVILRAMANAIVTEQFTGIEDNSSADRKLGRAEGVTLLISNIELAIDDKQRLQVEIKDDQKAEG